MSSPTRRTSVRRKNSKSPIKKQVARKKNQKTKSSLRSGTFEKAPLNYVSSFLDNEDRENLEAVSPYVRRNIQRDDKLKREKKLYNHNGLDCFLNYSKLSGHNQQYCKDKIDFLFRASLTMVLVNPLFIKNQKRIPSWGSVILSSNSVQLEINQKNTREVILDITDESGQIVKDIPRDQMVNYLYTHHAKAMYDLARNTSVDFVLYCPLTKEFINEFQNKNDNDYGVYVSFGFFDVYVGILEIQSSNRGEIEINFRNTVANDL